MIGMNKGFIPHPLFFIMGTGSNERMPAYAERDIHAWEERNLPTYITYNALVLLDCPSFFGLGSAFSLTLTRERRT
jgi:hypothetical protein